MPATKGKSSTAAKKTTAGTGKRSTATTGTSSRKTAKKTKTPAKSPAKNNSSGTARKSTSARTVTGKKPKSRAETGGTASAAASLRKKQTVQQTSRTRQKASSQEAELPVPMPLYDFPIIKETIVIIATFLCLLLFLSCFQKEGTALAGLKDWSFGCFGYTAYLVPFLFAALIWYVYRNSGDWKFLPKLAAGLVIVCDLCVLIALMKPDLIGGGVIGNGIRAFLYPRFTLIPSYLIVILVMVICLVVITQKSVLRMISSKSGHAIQSVQSDLELHRSNRELGKKERMLQKEMERSSRMERNRREIERLEAERQQAIARRMESSVSGIGNVTLDPEPVIGNNRQTKKDGSEEILITPIGTVSEGKVYKSEKPQRNFDLKQEMEREKETKKTDEFSGSIQFGTGVDWDPSQPLRNAEPVSYRESRTISELKAMDAASAPASSDPGFVQTTQTLTAQTMEDPITENIPVKGKEELAKEEPAEKTELEDIPIHGILTENTGGITELSSPSDGSDFPEDLSEDYSEELDADHADSDADGITELSPEVEEENEDPGMVLQKLASNDLNFSKKAAASAAPENKTVAEADMPRTKTVVTASGKTITVELDGLPGESRMPAEDARRRIREEQEGEIHPENYVEPKEYVFPPIRLLQKEAGAGYQGDSMAKSLKETAVKLQQTLQNFGVGVTVVNISCGPSVTRYELQPEQGVKVSKIVSLTDDIKLNLAAEDIRIEAPIPGKAAIGIEVPNKDKQIVRLRDLLESEKFHNHPSKLVFGAGKDIGGNIVLADIQKMPHLLIAGSTGSGKSVCINTLIMSVLYKARPSEVKMIMIDPKVVELSVYNGIPHLLIPVVTDPKKAAGALNWAVSEMTSRYQRFAELGVRDAKGYNTKLNDLPVEEGKTKPEKMPQIIIIVDELADLMMVAPGDVEDAICRLAQMARAAGIHLVIATQRPSVNVITGLIKANIPSRIAFSVSSGVDSRTIIDMNGAEKLLGKGDMLFYPSGYPKPVRVQGAFVTDEEVSNVVAFLAEQKHVIGGEQDASINLAGSSQDAGGVPSASDQDEYFEKAGMFIIEKEKASIGMLQRVFKIGFNRAARIMDQLAEAGVVGEEEGTKPRKVLMTLEEFRQYLEDYA